MLAGSVGGIVHYFLQINADLTFSEKLLESILTALVCGAAGYMGKETTIYIKTKISKRKKK